MQHPIQHQDTQASGGFYIHSNGQTIAEMTYIRSGAATVVVDHTFVDPSLRGQGVARQLLDALVAWARATNTKVVPECSYAVAQFAQDPSIADVLANA